MCTREKYSQLRGIESAMVKAGLPEKVACEHRWKRGSEPADKCEERGDEHKVTVLMQEMQSGKRHESTGAI